MKMMMICFTTMSYWSYPSASAPFITLLSLSLFLLLCFSRAPEHNYAELKVHFAHMR